MEYILSIKSCAVKNLRPNFVVLDGGVILTTLKPTTFNLITSNLIPNTFNL